MNRVSHLILTIFRVTLFIVTAATVIISPFVMKVWKEGEGHQLSIKKAQKVKKLKVLRSKSEAIEVNIKELTSNRRLMRYAADSLSIREAGPENVVVLKRQADGQVQERKDDALQRLKEMVKPE